MKFRELICLRDVPDNHRRWRLYSLLQAAVLSPGADQNRVTSFSLLKPSQGLRYAVGFALGTFGIQRREEALRRAVSHIARSAPAADDVAFGHQALELSLAYCPDPSEKSGHRACRTARQPSTGRNQLRRHAGVIDQPTPEQVDHNRYVEPTLDRAM